jgi:hypothetical protein
MSVSFDKTRRLEDLEKQVALLDLAVRQGQRDPTGIGKRWVYLAITARESVSYPDGDANTYPIIFLDRESTNTEGEHAADDTERSVDPVAYGRTVNGQPLLEGEVCYAYPLPKPVTDGKCRWVLEPLTKIYWGNLNEELTPGGSAEVSVYTPAGTGPDDWLDSGEDRTVYEVLMPDDAEPLPVDTKIGFVWYFDRFVMLGGAGGTGLTRFRLTGSLSTGGQANAKILTYNGTDYDVSAETITVIDWWAVTNQAPGLTRGMWQGVSGMEGWCRKRERPADEEEPPEQDEYEIVWMEQYARLIEFTLTEGFTAGESPSASVTASWDQGCAPGSTVIIHDPQDRWTDAIEGCKGTAIRDEYADAANPGTPHYRVVSCQRAAKRARATLTAAMCGSTVSVSGWQVYEQGEFVANPGAGTLINAAGHRGMLGDTVWLERIGNVAPFPWHVVDVERHAVQILTCATSIVEGELDKCCITAALEVCELPPCAEEETSSSGAPIPDIPDNSSVYGCCDWPQNPDPPIPATTTIVMSGVMYVENTEAEIFFGTLAGGKQSLTIGGTPTETENCLDRCFGRGLYNVEINIHCIQEGHVQGSSFPWAKDDSGTPLDPGKYLEVSYSWYPYGDSRTNRRLVPMEVLSCDPVHVRASVNFNTESLYYFDTSFGSGTWAKPFNWEPSECCGELEFDVEITE